jgi:hypothetical protein
MVTQVHLASKVVRKAPVGIEHRKVCTTNVTYPKFLMAGGSGRICELLKLALLF